MIECYESILLFLFLVKCRRRFDMEPTEGTKSTPVMASHKKSLRLRGAGDTPNDGEASKCAKLSAMGFMWNGLPSTTLMGILLMRIPVAYPIVCRKQTQELMISLI